MLPFAPETATAFWLRMAQSVAAGERVVIAAADEQQRLVGTVQLIIDQPENQPHRADVAKLLVHQNARRLGLANALMARLEAIAREQGKSVLVLDTATGSGAENFTCNAVGKRPGKFPAMR